MLASQIRSFVLAFGNCKELLLQAICLLNQQGSVRASPPPARLPQVSIGKELKSALGLDASSKIGYAVHVSLLPLCARPAWLHAVRCLLLCACCFAKVFSSGCADEQQSTCFWLELPGCALYSAVPAV